VREVNIPAHSGIREYDGSARVRNKGSVVSRRILRYKKMARNHKLETTISKQAKTLPHVHHENMTKKKTMNQKKNLKK
jgi:hypothetical protein